MNREITERFRLHLKKARSKSRLLRLKLTAIRINFATKNGYDNILDAIQKAIDLENLLITALIMAENNSNYENKGRSNKGK